MLNVINKQILPHLRWFFSSSSVFSFRRDFEEKAAFVIYIKACLFHSRCPIGAGDEPFKNGSRDKLWEKERLCKQIINPCRHSSEVKLCQLAVMGSSLVKRSGSTSSTQTLFMVPLWRQPLFSSRRTNRGHRPTEVGFAMTHQTDGEFTGGLTAGPLFFLLHRPLRSAVK